MNTAQPLGQMIIELGLDGSNFTSGMKGVNQHIKTSMTEMKAHLAVIGQSGSALDKLKAKQVGLSEVIGAQNKKVALAKEKYDACKTAVEGNAQATQQQKDALIKAQNEYVRAIGELGSYENQLREVNIRLTAMESNLHQTGTAMVSFGQNLSRIGDRATKVGKMLTVGITTPILLLGKSAIKVTADFESGMSQVQATMGITKDAMSTLDEQSVNTMNALSDLAKQMGAETKFSATEAATAINNMAMAGYDTQKIYDTLPDVLNLATAGALDLDYATQLAANGLNVMGLETSDMGELADKLAVTASSAYGSVSDFGEGLLKAGGQASLANINLTDTFTALGILGDAGISAAEGGTMLRNVIKNLYTPTNVASAALGDLGIATANSDGSLRDFQVVLQELDSALSGLTEDEKVKAMSNIFDTRTIAGANALLKASGEEFDKLSTAIEASAGASQKMADTQLDNLGGQLIKLRSTTEAIGISFGEIMLPAVKAVTSGVQGLADGLNHLDNKQKQTIVRVVSVAAVVGPTVLVIGKLTSGIGSLATGIGKGMQKFAEFDARLRVTTGLTTAQTVATKLHGAAETVKNMVIAAGNGTLTAQVVALNASITAKIKDTAAAVAHTVVEKARNIAVGISTTNFSLQAIATTAQTVATGALTVATGFLSVAINILLGPIGWAIAAITLLVVGVVAAVKWFNKESEAAKELKADTEELANANDGLVESLKTSKTSYEDNIKSIKTETGATKTLADKVAELSKIEHKSAKQKKELQIYVGMLNSSMEGLNLQYDEQTDMLSTTTAQIYSQIAALKKQAEAQAAQERMTEILKEEMLVKEQLIQVQNKLTEATENDNLKSTERKNILAELTDQETALQGELEVLGDSYAYVTEIIVESAVAEAGAVLGSSQTIIEAYGSIASAYEDLGERQQSAIDKIKETYETMVSRLSDLTSQIKQDDETTWASIQENQADTIVKTTEFSNLYGQLIKAGVSESYLNAIGATGPESIPLLQDMLSQGTDTILASQAEWQDAYGVIGNTLTDVLELDDSTEAAIKDYILGESGVYGTFMGTIEAADLNSLGKSITDGVSAGILESTDNLTNAVTGMADETTDAAMEAWDINSPSKVFTEIGKYLMQGLTQGISSNEKAVYAKVTTIANNITKTMKTALDIHSPSRIMRDEIGKNIALGIAEGITQNADYVEKSVEEVAVAILQSAKTKLENTKVYTELSLADEVAYWDSIRKQVTEGTQAKIDADKQYFQSKKSLNEKMVGIEKDYASKTKKVYEDLDKNIKSLQDSYTDKLTSRTQSIMGSMNLFDEFTAKTKLSTADLLGNLKSQVDGLEDWSNNLKNLEKRGIGGDMLAELRGMGTGAAGEIALLTELTNAELKEYKALWKQKQRFAKKEASKELKPVLEEMELQMAEMNMAAAQGLEEYKQEFVSAMSEIGMQIQAPLETIQTSLQNAMTAIVQTVAGTVSNESEKQTNVNQFKSLSASVVKTAETLPNDFVVIGQNTVSGLILGLQNKAGELRQTMSEIIKGAINVVREEAQIHSPSRVMASLGSYMIEGLGIGMESMQNYIGSVVSDTDNMIVNGLDSVFGNTRMYDLNLSTTLNDKMETVEFIDRALTALTHKEDSNKNSEQADVLRLMEQTLSSYDKMIELLQTIAAKELLIDKRSFVGKVDLELGNLQALKARGV